MSETKGDLFRKKIKDSLENKSFITKETELPKGKMLEADDESVRKEFKNRYNKKIEKKEKLKKMTPLKKLKSGGRIGLKAGSTGCKLAKKGKGRAYGKNS